MASHRHILSLIIIRLLFWRFYFFNFQYKFSLFHVSYFDSFGKGFIHYYVKECRKIMTMDDKLLEFQDKIERKVGGIGKGKYSRILKMAKKPARDEYLKVVLITGAGIIILGLVGFFIYLIMGVYIHLP